MNNIPWVEKYRPKSFEKIVLTTYNKAILSNILKKNYFPNLLFYGPPGTGKTTTIINLISEYQNMYNQKHKELIIHLNASDDRGIEIIRNQINQFVNSKNLFGKGVKFVILDEVDYMTKNAQQALKFLIQECSNNIRFCLICNYISKIDYSLQNEFVKLCFNKLPQCDILNFIKIIVEQEKINVSLNTLKIIQKTYNSDIRSMINYIQSNQNNLSEKTIMTDKIYEKIFITITNKNLSKGEIKKEIMLISSNYNIETKNIIKELLSYIVIFKLKYIENKQEIMNFIKYIIHNLNINNEYLLNYTINCLLKIKIL
tara:strand:+ start:844 stop:1785 length:942 start_codon:yes stop_codon:yes gene_type:complete